MVEYFKELENPKEQYLDLIDKYHFLNYPNIEPKYILLDYFIKHKVLFEKIKYYDLLYEKNNKQIKLYTNPENAIEEDEFWGGGFDFDWMYNYSMKYGILTYEDMYGSGLSKNALYKICELEYKLIMNNEEMDMAYFINIIDMLLESGRIFWITLNHVYKFLNTSYNMAKVQKKLNMM